MTLGAEVLVLMIKLRKSIISSLVTAVVAQLVCLMRKIGNSKSDSYMYVYKPNKPKSSKLTAKVLLPEVDVRGHLTNRSVNQR